MARVVKEYAVRRNEILDVAQRLVYTKGYEQMTIQDILDDLQIAKGTFFHYFASKQALLEALIDRMTQEVESILIPIVDDPHLPALEKLNRYLATAVRWKTARKAFFLSLLRVWYTDDNAIVRQKVLAAGFKRVTPFLTAIIHQGIREGVLTTEYPDHVGQLLLSLMQSLGDSIAELLLSHEPSRDPLQLIESTVAAYTDALERVLGAPTGSLEIVDAGTLREWVVSDVAIPNCEGQQCALRP
jgi:AcrR family transcriptional regulator